MLGRDSGINECQQEGQRKASGRADYRLDRFQSAPDSVEFRFVEAHHSQHLQTFNSHPNAARLAAEAERAVRPIMVRTTADAPPLISSISIA